MRWMLLVVVLVMTACSPTDATTTTSAAASSTTSAIPATTTTAPAPSTTAPISGPIVIAESAELIGAQVSGLPEPSFNPFVDASPSSLPAVLDPLLFAGAWAPGPDGEPLPDLVTALPHPADGTARLGSDGELTLAYSIDPEAKWEDGTPITSADFELTLLLLQDEAITTRPDWFEWHTGVTGMRVVSDAEFEVTMGPPFTRYRHLFPVVVPAHIVDRATFVEDWNTAPWPSAGSMRLVSNERFDAPLAGSMSLEPNPEHGVVPAFGIRIDFYQRDERGDSLAVKAFLNGDADILGSHALSGSDLDRVGDAALVSAVPQIWEALFLQPGDQRLVVGQHSMTNLLGLRQRIANALLAEPNDLPGDRITSLVEYFLPGTENPSGGWDPAYTYGPALIGPHALVYESTDGELTMEIGRAVETLLEAAGLVVELRFDRDAQAAFGRFGAGDFEAFAVRLARQPGSEALYDLFRMLAEPRDGFPDVWPDEQSKVEFLDLLTRFDDELDQEERIGILIDAEQLLVNAMVVIPLVTRETERWAYHQDRILGPADYDGQGLLATLSNWRRP